MSVKVLAVLVRQTGHSPADMAMDDISGVLAVVGVQFLVESLKLNLVGRVASPLFAKEQL